MKSFSATSFAGDHEAALDQAMVAVRNDPLALFSDFQWFLWKAQNTVYFTAFSAELYSKDMLTNFVAEMALLAPSLTHGFVGACPGQPFPKHMLDAITSVREVDSFDGYPDAWLEPGLDLFDSKDLPLFRVMAVVRKDGPDAEGRSSMLMIRASHALLEGSDSALLTRSQNSSHGTVVPKQKKVPFSHRFKYAAIAYLTTPIHLLSAHLLAKGAKPMGFKSLAIERQRLRVLSKKLGVRTRSLMFALVTHALNGKEKALNQKIVACAYTMLDNERHEADDPFMRVRALDAKFTVIEDFVDYVRAVDDAVAAVEQKDITKMQFILNATFKLHRALNKVLPFLYSPKFFRFNGTYDVILTLVPPHRLYGNMTKSLNEPIFVGSYHPGSNLCTFVPARKYVTFNFSMETRHIANADRVMALLDEVEAREVTPRVMPKAVERL